MCEIDGLLGGLNMRILTFVVLASLTTLVSNAAGAVPDPNAPTWWSKYQHIQQSSGILAASTSQPVSIGDNVDVSNECGPQSETFIAMKDGSTIAGGSNEIFRLPMRAYFSSDGGKTWGADDVPLPPAKGANGIDFGSIPPSPSTLGATSSTAPSSYFSVPARASTAPNCQWRARPTGAKPGRRASSASLAVATISTTSR
jgi:hypothetical protein